MIFHLSATVEEAHLVMSNDLLQLLNCGFIAHGVCQIIWKFGTPDFDLLH